MINYAPIVLFIYKRPEHLKKTLQSLSNCHGYQNHKFLVFGDGPKNSTEDLLVKQTRSLAFDYLGDKAEYYFSDLNKGLANSVIDGINKTFQKFDRAIIIEDDLVFHPNFLNFMNSTLDIYVHNDDVSMISGYMYKVESLKNYKNQIFLPLISTWGWGTWSRAWNHFDSYAIGYENLTKDKRLRKNFDCNGSYPFSRMLELQMQNKIDSWGIRWYWTNFKRNKLTCFPPNTLVLNNGFDSTATHGRGFLTNFSKNKFLDDKFYKFIINNDIPISVDESLYLDFCNSMFDLNGGLKGKFRDFIKRYTIDFFRKKIKH